MKKKDTDVDKIPELIESVFRKRLAKHGFGEKAIRVILRARVEAMTEVVFGLTEKRKEE